MSNSDVVYSFISTECGDVCERMNEFSELRLRTRGGRIGSGMGALLEALWGFMMNEQMAQCGNNLCEIAWLPDNQYNDFACLNPLETWDMDSRSGEFFRIEAKSMNRAAVESKAHFTAIKEEVCDNDSLLILVWEWSPVSDSSNYRYPKVVDSYYGRALDIVKLRDELHISRGGSFVDKNHCPDGCEPSACTHAGEPLNASGKRERVTGPISCRGDNASFAANFGGLVRMLKTRTNESKRVFRQFRIARGAQEEFISFIFKNYPDEELNHYGIDALKRAAQREGLNPEGMGKADIYALLKTKYPDSCIEALRNE